MYLDLNNTLNTGLKQLNTAAERAVVTIRKAGVQGSKNVAGSKGSLDEIFNRVTCEPFGYMDLLAMHGHIPGVAPVARVKAPKVDLAAIIENMADIEAKAQTGFDFMDFLAAHGYMAETKSEIPTPAEEVKELRAA